MKKVNQYSDQFKRMVVNEILSGDESLEYYRRKYRIGGSMTISRWFDKFAAEAIPPPMAKKEETAKS